MSEHRTALFLIDGSKNLWDILAQVRSGFSVRAVEHFIKSSGLERKLVLKAARISNRTFERKSQTSLTPKQSDRLARIKRIYDMTTDLIGDSQLTCIWLQSPNEMLGGEKPLEFLDTDAGARCVENILFSAK